MQGPRIKNELYALLSLVACLGASSARAQTVPPAAAAVSPPEASAPNPTQTAPDAVAMKGPKTYDSFSDLRADVLNAIGGASKRIWLTTGYLTDGEIVSALYVAQYRKVQVHVLLGRAKANQYMSRLNYLKNQNIPVYLIPDSFRPAAATEILCDDRLLMLDGDLDFMTKYKHFSLKQASATELAAFAQAFAAAADLKVAANAAPMPLVGHARPQPVYSGRGRGIRPAGMEPHYNQQDGSGAYTYDRHGEPRPEGVPAKLPKALKWELQSKQPPVLKEDTDLDKGD